MTAQSHTAWTLHCEPLDYLDGIQSGLIVRADNGAPVAYMFDHAAAVLATAAPRLLRSLVQTRIALAGLKTRAEGFSVSGVGFDDPCFTENFTACEMAEEALEAADAAIARATREAAA